MGRNWLDLVRVNHFQQRIISVIAEIKEVFLKWFNTDEPKSEFDKKFGFLLKEGIATKEDYEKAKEYFNNNISK